MSTTLKSLESKRQVLAIKKSFFFVLLCFSKTTLFIQTGSNTQSPTMIADNRRIADKNKEQTAESKKQIANSKAESKKAARHCVHTAPKWVSGLPTGCSGTSERNAGIVNT